MAKMSRLTDDDGNQIGPERDLECGSWKYTSNKSKEAYKEICLKEIEDEPMAYINKENGGFVWAIYDYCSKVILFNVDIVNSADELWSAVCGAYR